MDKSKLLKNILLFGIIFLGLNLIFKSCEPAEEQQSLIDQGELGFITSDTTYSRNDTVEVSIKNNAEEEIIIESECPGEPFDVLHYENGEWVQVTSDPEIDCELATDIHLQPGEELTIPYDNWNYSLFSQLGRFKISNGTFDTNEFIVEEEGTFGKLWNAILYRPTYNALIFFAYIFPGHSLGIAIILLTILFRTILLAPSQKAMKAQKRMQEVQPMLEKIKEKYKGDQQKISQETMALWKEQKVNPMGSCLPLLMQFPVLIALFWVIKSGLNPDKIHLLYTTYADFSLASINTQFLGLDLLKPNQYVLPVIVGLLQFGQMKISLAKKGKNKDGKKNEMAIANSMMTYVMPIMIAVFTASLPAGVGIYWGTSTLYGIVQQVFVNKDSDKGNSPKKKDKNSENVKVRVIEDKKD